MEPDSFEYFPTKRDHELRVERLGRLAMKMERIRPTKTRHFHLAHWEEEQDCGTAACAVGYAMVDPWFNARGLKRDPFGVPVCGIYRGGSAAIEFFRLSRRDMEHLFYPGHYKLDERGNPRVVAKRIREFLAKCERRSALAEAEGKP